MPRRNYKVLVIMPYLSLGGVLEPAGFTFIPSKNDLSSFVPDVALLEHIKSILAMYKSPSGHVVQNPTIVCYSGSDFRRPQNKTINKFYDLRATMIFSSFLKNNSWSFSTTDNFEVVFQRFNVGEEGIALQGGSLHGILAGGLKISNTVFTTPPHVNVSTLHNSFESNVLFALVKCVEEQKSNPGCSAIIRSLKSFSSAYRNSHEIDNSSRVLSMITAFELLFGVSSRAQFRTNIKKYSEDLSPTSYPYQEIHTRTGNSRPINLTGIEVWAEEFYKLRHRIIHADVVTGDDYKFKDMTGSIFTRGNPHIAVSFEIYAVCLTNKLRELGFLNDYHIVLTQKGNYPFNDKGFMNIQNREFVIVDRGLHDLLSRI